jgi:hypothetical protein
MMDNVRLWSDPSYQSSLNRIRSKRYRDYGQEYWWGPAETPMEVLEDL